MTEQRKDFPEFYLTRPQPCPYLPDRQERKLFTHLIADKSQAQFDFLHSDGFRRSQTIAYRPHCENCAACISVRIRVEDFSLTKSQKRVWRSNQDLISTRSDTNSGAEQYALFKAYVETRHGDGGMADMSLFDYQAMIEDSVVDSFLTEYRLPYREPATSSLASVADLSDQPMFQNVRRTNLIGVSLCDRLSDGISLVYSFFDPLLEPRSMGTYMILETIDYARALELPYVYLGYWVKGSPKMDYKVRFLPQDHLMHGEWVRVDKGDI